MTPNAFIANSAGETVAVPTVAAFHVDRSWFVATRLSSILVANWPSGACRCNEDRRKKPGAFAVLEALLECFFCAFSQIVSSVSAKSLLRRSCLLSINKNHFYSAGTAGANGAILP
jgi:hypothetical protein